MSGVEGMCMSTTCLFSFMLSTQTCTHTWQQVQGCRRAHGTEGGPCCRWHRAPRCTPSHHWRLCGHGLMYGLQYGKRHASPFSHYRVTRAAASRQTLFSVRTPTLICHQRIRRVSGGSCISHIHYKYTLIHLLMPS